MSMDSINGLNRPTMTIRPQDFDESQRRQRNLNLTLSAVGATTSIASIATLGAKSSLSPAFKIGMGILSAFGGIVTAKCFNNAIEAERKRPVMIRDMYA